MDRLCFLSSVLIFSATILIMSCKDDQPGNPDNPPEVYKAVKHIGTAEISQARLGLTAAAVGNKILFAGGCIKVRDYEVPGGAFFYRNFNRVDIYDAASDTWSIDSLGIARSEVTAVALNNKIFFAGGWFNQNGASIPVYTKRIDIYDATTNTWQIDSLSDQNYNIAAGAVGNQAIFAGGTSLDIYDMLSNTWDRSQLSAPIAGQAAVSGNELFVAKAGVATKDVDVYSVSNNSLRTIQMSIERSDVTVAAAGGLVLFAGGSLADYSYTKLVEIYDTKTNTWSKDSLSQGRAGMTAVAAGNKILFAGGVSGIANSKVVDVYDVATGKWSQDSLSYPSHKPAGATVGNKVVFAIASQDSKVVDIFELRK